MKATLLTLSLFALSSFSLFAQSQQPTKESLRTAARIKHEKMLKAMTRPNFQVDAKKTRGGSRLISYATNNIISPIPPITYEPSDSTHYSYNSNYGFDITPTLFESSIDLNSFTSSKKDYYDRSEMWMNDGSGSLSQFDTTNCGFTTNHKLAYENSDYFALGYQGSINYAYNASGQRILELDSTFMAPDTFVQKYITSYDASNRLNCYEYQEWDNTALTFIPSFKDSFFYNSSNNLIQVKEYAYDPSSSTWGPSYYGDLTYNAANKITSMQSYEWDGTTFNNYYKSDYVYNASNQLVSNTNSSWYIPTSTWRPEDKDSFQYATSSYPSMKITQQYDTMSSTMLNSNRFTYTYNSSNQIDEVVTDYWDGSAWVGISDAHYHYENFNPEAVDDIAQEAGSIQIYPSPTSGIVNISINWNEKQSATLNVCDLNGRSIISKPISSSSKMNETINLSDLTSGVYFIQLVGEKGSLVRKVVRN